MIVIHIGILIYPVKDSAERAFSKSGFFFILLVIPLKFRKKMNWSMTNGILLHLILQNDYNIIL